MYSVHLQVHCSISWQLESVYRDKRDEFCFRGARDSPYQSYTRALLRMTDVPIVPHKITRDPL